MFKLVCMMKRKPGTSFDEFRRHYEAVHAPMGLTSLANADRYFRRYLHPVAELEMDDDLTRAITAVGASRSVLGEDETEFDVITEIWFKNRAEFEKAFRAMGSRDHVEKSVGDSVQFMDLSKSRMFFVEEVETDFKRSEVLK
jgi:EthD domain